MIKLTTKEVADLMDISQSRLRDLISQGKIVTEKALDDKKRLINLIPLESLEPELQAKYYLNYKMDVSELMPPIVKKQSKPLDHYSAEERNEIGKWIDIVNRWQAYRKNRNSKSEADQEFIDCMKKEGVHVSYNILYKKWKAYENDDLDGLFDKRGLDRKGKHYMNEEIWKVFCGLYLDERKFSIRRCYAMTIEWAETNRPELVEGIPHFTTFSRRLKEIPKSAMVLGREGEKAFHDNCTPYIRRVYDDLRSNEYWIGDTHTLDIMSEGEDGSVHRLHLTAYMDARSGIFTGWYLGESSKSQISIYALQRGIKKHGIPDNLYLDNGREYLTFDFGGLGHRKKKSQEDKYQPPTILDRLGIKMTNALVRNARAKIIERRFLDFKNEISKLFETYTGGTIIEKPESLKLVLKKGNIIKDEELIEKLEILIEGHLNRQAYGGAVEEDRGKPKIDVFHENLINKRTATKDDLYLMMMRSTRAQKISRRGVSLKIGGKQLDYFNSDLLAMQGKQVYLRYDPDDLKQVRVYDLEDRFVMEVPVNDTMMLEYGADVEMVKETMREMRRYEKIEKQRKESLIHPEVNRQTAFELIYGKALLNKDKPVASVPEDINIDIQRAKETPLLHDITRPSIDRMLANAMKNNEES